MKTSPLPDQSDTLSPGVRYLRMLWGIPDRPPREVPPADVDTNIYHTPSRGGGSPRHRRRRR